jgi:hypothetical protein
VGIIPTVAICLTSLSIVRLKLLLHSLNSLSNGHRIQVASFQLFLHWFIWKLLQIYLFYISAKINYRTFLTNRLKLIILQINDDTSTTIAYLNATYVKKSSILTKFLIIFVDRSRCGNIQIYK